MIRAQLKELMHLKIVILKCVLIHVTQKDIQKFNEN